MLKVVLIARLILGFIFVVFGLNGFLNFIPVPEMNDQANSFMGIMFTSGWLTVVKLIEIAGGVCLLAGRMVPFGLTLLGPVIFNILMFHLMLDRGGLPMAVILTLVEAFLIWAYWPSFNAVLAVEAKPRAF